MGLSKARLHPLSVSRTVAACGEDPVAREGEAGAAVHVLPDHLDLGPDLPGPAALVSRSVLPRRGTGAGGSPPCGPCFR